MAGCNFFCPLSNFLSASENEVDEVCSICSSKDIMQPLFHAKSLNVNNYWRQQNKEKSPRRHDITFIFDVLSENVITFARIYLYPTTKNIVNLRKTSFFSKTRLLAQLQLWGYISCHKIYYTVSFLNIASIRFGK